MYQIKNQTAFKFISILGLFALVCAILPQSSVWAQTNWATVPGAALDIGAGGGKIWVIGTDGNIYPYNPHPSRVSNPWDPFAPPAQGCSAIAVDSEGKGWVVGGQKSIHRFVQ